MCENDIGYNMTQKFMGEVIREADNANIRIQVTSRIRLLFSIECDIKYQLMLELGSHQEVDGYRLVRKSGGISQIHNTLVIIDSNFTLMEK